MTVHFIGAGPGAPDLLTLRGRDLIAASPVCLYAGSLIPAAMLDHCPPGARRINTAPLSLDDIIAEIQAAHDAGDDVARLHSGDLSIWSAMGEQLRRLRALDIPITITPGVPAFAAAAAALEIELTLPGVAQSVVLTRTPGRASAMPPAETLTAFAATGATLAIHLSVHNLAQVVADLTPDRLARQLARPADRTYDAGDDCSDDRGQARSHGADPRRPGDLAARFCRQQPLCDRL
jgi:precorrin-4/cobalt-precorrin-4 C11-methyltransferase